MMEKRNIVTSDTPQDTAKTAEVAERGAKAFEKSGLPLTRREVPFKRLTKKKDADNAGATSTR